MINVFIVDDQDLVREGIRQFLKVDREIRVVGEASGAREGLERIENLRPDIVFMDIRMPGINGIEATRVIKERFPGMKVILLTNYNDEEYVYKGLEAGAKAFILKNITRSEMLKVTHAIYNDQAVLDPAITSKVISKMLLSKLDQPAKPGISCENFTFRELEVLEGIVKGQTNKRIGEFLYISETTVKHHIRNIFRKLGVKSRTEAISKSVRKKIINLDCS
jgi:DNA-binding NarL/FixJ family response regulator